MAAVVRPLPEAYHSADSPYVSIHALLATANGIFLENLLVPLLLWNPKIHCQVSRLLHPTLSQKDLVDSLQPINLFLCYPGLCHSSGSWTLAPVQCHLTSWRMERHWGRVLYELLRSLIVVSRQRIIISLVVQLDFLFLQTKQDVKTRTEFMWFKVTVHWWAFVNTVMNLWVPKKVDFLNNWKTISFSRRPLLYIVSDYLYTAVQGKGKVVPVLN
jgi:hypothetical protein